MFDYDLAVIGSGPAGHHAAIQGSKLRKRVILIERQPFLGGICTNIGTIPSKTMREAILYLSGYREHSIYGDSYRVKKTITPPDLLFRVKSVVNHEIDIMRNQLLRNGVELVQACASFLDPHTLRLDEAPAVQRQLTAERMVIAVGTEAVRDSRMPLDGCFVFSSDDIMQMKELPRTLLVIGAGVIGCEYASMFAALGVRVTLVDMRSRLLDFVDAEIVDTLAYHMREQRIILRLGETVTSAELMKNEPQPQVRTILASGKQILADRVLSSMGRNGATAGLNLSAAGLATDARGRIKVNQHYQTEVAHIYAAGDVIGFPSLASTSSEQGRIAVCHAFAHALTDASAMFPFGIYTIPEISFVGKTEEQLTENNIPYEIGKAQYRECARGQIIGDTTGVLKLLFHRESKQLLGVHIIGDGAVELVHVGQAVIGLNGTIDYFLKTVFNYPTLAECYKTAALDGVNRLAS